MKKGTKIFIGALVAVLLIVGAGAAVFAADPPKNTGVPPMGPGWGRGGEFGSLDAVAKLLGLTQEEIQAQRQAGKSLVQIAASKNITEDALINAIMAEKKTFIDRLLKDGKLTQERATQMLDQMKQMTKTMVERTTVGPPADRGMFGGRPFTGAMGPGMMFGFGPGNDDAVTKLLGMTREEIQTQRQAGKSLAQIAASKNISEDALINAIIASMKTNLDKLVADGKLTQDKATQMLDNMKQKVKAMVESTAVGPQAGKGFRGGCATPGAGMGPGMMKGWGKQGSVPGTGTGTGGMMRGGRGV